MERLQNGTPMLTAEELRNLTDPANADYPCNDDAMVWAKFFDPYATNWTWYATFYEEDEGIFWGYVEGFENEWGSWYASDLLRPIRMPGIGIERDLYFTPGRLGDVKERG